MDIIKGLEQIGVVLNEIVAQKNPPNVNDNINDIENDDKKHQKPLLEKQRLRFINQSVCDYSKIVANLIDYFELNLPKEESKLLKEKIDTINDEECKICELITQLIKQTESDLDENADMLEQILVFLAGIPKNIREHIKEINPDHFELDDDIRFKIQFAINQVSLMVYDSMQMLQSIQDKLIEICSLYHIPYYYETNDYYIKLRRSISITYKNLYTIINDFQTLSYALWMVRHYESVMMSSSNENK
ncbi:uncharacterized protein LOC113798499 [Dermatophagoides pteronyssinus]|uniref:Uncharacterized protein LOC113798499 n=2 Tax=Dermatophagoides pteronyssinus TaxID=6956 RepID=A0A6P6YHZ6_DERPT|nr:uncharacterized protein LOC113798499 [Dermatophagoides pteronyssinus]KAH9415554.1 hypothetical protein DERP_000039 [Dermatophagoides pteronyssinus]